MLNAELRDRCLKLSRKERTELKEYLVRSLLTPEYHPDNRFYYLLKIAADILGYDEITDNSQTAEATDARRAVIAVMIEEGFTALEISKQSGRQRSTVYRYYNDYRYAMVHSRSLSSIKLKSLSDEIKKRAKK